MLRFANGGGPAITALLGKNAQTSVQAVSGSLGHINAGKIRALASFGATRSHALPDVPTLKELCYDVEYYLRVGIFAPHGTPAPVLAALSKTIDQPPHPNSTGTRSPISARSSPT